MNEIKGMIARLEEQSRWVNSKLDKIENKLDRLHASHTAFKWKVTGGVIVLTFLMTLAVEVFRR